MHGDYFRIGGVDQDLPPKLNDDIEAWCDPFLGVVDDLDRLLTGNRIFKQRNVDIGVVTLKQAWEWGFSGVMVRGSGAAWDLRKSQPYECYAEMEFDIPIGKNGDCYDRYCIRMEEMRQSVRIIRQCIKKLKAPDGQGPVLAEHNKVAPPRRGEMKPATIQFDRAAGALEGANLWERTAALALVTGSKISSHFSHRGYNGCANLLRKTLPERNIAIKLNSDAVFEFPYGDGYWSKLLNRSYHYEDELELLFRDSADVDYTLLDCGANYGYWSSLVSSAPFRSHKAIPTDPASQNFPNLAHNAQITT